MFDNRSILVTGGTGSFGKRLISRLLKDHKPSRVIVFSRDEFKQSEMAQNPVYQRPAVRFFIGDVRSRQRLSQAFRGVDYVVHAAAMKQVPASEYNPFEAIQTNVLGAQNIVDTAIELGVRRVIALSTDKACNPINLYGATKLCSDKLFIAGNVYAGGRDTRFGVVRYGNVVGSRGSVIPLFLRQRETGTVTITHKDMTRFWITLDQGVDFVLAALERMKVGELFVPKIPSMKIVDLARAIAPECEQKFVGIRPGEKMHEVMISEDDALLAVDTGDSYIIRPALQSWSGGREATSEHPPVPAGFRYSSDNNDQWLSSDDLRDVVSDWQSKQSIPPP